MFWKTKPEKEVAPEVTPEVTPEVKPEPELVKKVKLTIFFRQDTNLNAYILFTEHDYEGDQAVPDDFRRFIEWVERPRTDKSVKDGFYTMYHRTGFTTIRWSSIVRVDVLNYQETRDAE